VLVIPPDEDEVLHARRLVAQQCLYGVDKNPMAVDLAKLSLWLATLARDHPFTFLDHSLRCGDSLVGLTKEQIAAFHWTRTPALTTHHQPLTTLFKRSDCRAHAEGYGLPAADSGRTRCQALRATAQELGVADDALSLVKLTGDLVIAAFFCGE